MDAACSPLPPPVEHPYLAASRTIDDALLPVPAGHRLYVESVRAAPSDGEAPAAAADDSWDRPIVILQRPDSTDGILWDGAGVLAQYLASAYAPGELAGMGTICELGAGTGFLGVFLARKLGVNNIVMTDNCEEALDTMRANVLANGLALYPDRQPGKLCVRVAELDWGHDGVDWLGPIDLVVASELLYHPVSLDAVTMAPLLTVLARLFEENARMRFILEYTLRPQHSLAAAVRLFADAGYAVDQVDDALVPRFGLKSVKKFILIITAK